MSKRREPASQPAPGTSLGTLGDLLARRGMHGSAPAPASVAVAPAPRTLDARDLSRCGKIVLRRERRGHGGKTTTVVTGLGLPLRDLERLARTLRRALGCGTSIDGDRLVVQGDQVSRVEGWLSAHGARRIVVGN
jgi:translation initiation factor 1